MQVILAAARRSPWLRSPVDAGSLHVAFKRFALYPPRSERYRWGGMTSLSVRSGFLHVLRDDLVGPDPDDPRDAAHAAETLSAAPSHWYLTGFLAPTGQNAEDKEDDEAGADLGSAVDDPSDGEAEAPVARRPVFPSSVGLSVLVRPECTRLSVRAVFATYTPVPAKPTTTRDVRSPRTRDSSAPPAGATSGNSPATSGSGARASEPPDGEEPSLRVHWQRTPHDFTETIPLDGKARFDVPLSGFDDVSLRVVLRKVPETEIGLVPPGTRYATIFLVNDRKPVQRPEQDRGYLFQVRFSIRCTEGFVPRPNLRGIRKEDDIDERVGDLHYRDAFEYAVGHGAAAWASVKGQGEHVFCEEVGTTWLPTAEIEKVVPCAVKDVELRMAELGKKRDAAGIHEALDKLVADYGEWIDRQAETDLSRWPTRADTASALLAAARTARDRIQRGIDLLATDETAREAFEIANQAMAAAQIQREKQKNPEAVKDGKFVPAWRPFQLAFLLMNMAAQRDPGDAEREIVDLIFFPTGGGKTEAYLGLAAFTLVLRRLTHPGVQSAGVTVLMRYTLRLLTLDQLERAATLVCALEILRRADPDKLGPKRFSIGLWVGKGATPNRFGTDQDRDETTALHRVKAFRKDPDNNPSPVPIDKCPWCGADFTQDTFDLKPDYKAPQQLRIVCSKKCDFRWKKEHPEGIPVLAVDDEIYRELPCFLIATVDKFAGLPWVGKTGLLLGRNATHHNALGFHGPAQMPPDAKPLPSPLLPPDLVIQDELHLISGPLGTMVGLYETAMDHLMTRTLEGEPGAKVVRPKIIASTATVRRAQAQIQALFGRRHVEIFPPPGPNRRTSFFAETVPTTRANARLYAGVAAPGRSMKVVLLRTYIALLSAAQKAFEEDSKSADPYMTLVGYFNSLRELGGSQRIVEEEVRARLLRAGLRHRVGEVSAYFVDRRISDECVELTSRRTTDEVKVAKERLEQKFSEATKKHPAVDVALASNMISVGVDITRLGLMVVCGQPKTTAEYIQATSRVGRDDARPGLVVTLLNVHKPRDRSHFEHFAAYHQSFYRGVEATSVTPFSPRAVDRGLAGLVVALARLGHEALTPPDGAEKIAAVKDQLGFVADVLATRAEVHRNGRPDDEPIDEVKAALRGRVEELLDLWSKVVNDDVSMDGLSYQRFEEGNSSKRPLLRMPLDPDLASCKAHERAFVANRSMRDVEGTTDVYVAKLKDSQISMEEGS